MNGSYRIGDGIAEGLPANRAMVQRMGRGESGRGSHMNKKWIRQRQIVK